MMVDPIGRDSPLLQDTFHLREQRENRRPQVTVPTPQSPDSEPTGGGVGAKIGAKVGGQNSIGGEAHAEGGGDTFGGAYIDGGGEANVSIPGLTVGGEFNGRYYHFDDTGRFSRSEAGVHWEVGWQGTSKGASSRVVWDNNPITPELSGRKWDQIGGKFVERIGADDLERDGASTGLHGLFFGFENDHRFNPDGFRYERNDYVGAGAYWERDVLGLATYDPPSANVYTTNKFGLGIGRIGLYGSEMEQEKLDSSWTLDLDPQYRGETPGIFNEVARERAAASHAQLSLPARNAEVLDSQGLGTREAYLDTIEKTVERTKLPADVVIDRMHLAVHQAAIAIDNDPNKSAGEAFAEQPALDRRAPIEIALSEGLPPAAALDVALARAQGDLRPSQDIINSSNLNGTSTSADFSEDAVAMEAIYSHMSGGLPNFDAIVAAGKAHQAGDARNAGALVTDYHDNGVIDGSNVVNVSFGDETYAVLPGDGVQMVAQTDGTIVPVETMRRETAKGLLSMIETAREQERAGKVDIAKSVVLEAKQQGVSSEGQRALYNQVRTGQEAFGDSRNAGALIDDSRDNGFIDGSNLPEATIGDETYAVSTGGGVMHGRTTMTPGELAARANARGPDPDAVDTDEVAKAMADAMAQSLREGFSARDQVAVHAPESGAPGGAAAAVRQDLEAMVDGENGAALAGRERKAIEGLIDQARTIEEAARFEGAKGLADNEYDVALQVRERDALDGMIAAANELEALADVPIPVFKPDQSSTETSNGPDMRGDKVAFGRGVVEMGPSGKNVAYDSFSDAFAVPLR